MSDLGNVIGYYDMGEVAEAKGDYFNAAKYFRQCYLCYEFGELPFFMEEVERKGGEAYVRYNQLLAKLTNEEVDEIKGRNEKSGFESGDINVNIESFENAFCYWSKNRFDEH